MGLPSLRTRAASVLGVLLLLTVGLAIAACCCDGPFCKIPACDPCKPCAPAVPAAGPAAPATQPASPAARPPQPPTVAVEPPADPTKPATVGRDVGHMHNVHEVTPRFIRGSQPETEHDFEEIAKLGAKVVVSVDGATPDVEAAHKHGLRYVHVPMGYDGPSREEEVLLFKAFTTLEGPFYVHCHHGKHRGPAACALGLMAVEGWTPEQVVAELRRAGTAAKYEGLYAFPGHFERPTPAELAAAPASIPEVSPVLGLTAAMVLVDQNWERVGAVKKAGWKSPSDHPDVSPGHEATILAQRYREMARLDEVVKSKPEMLRLAQASEQAAWDLSKALRDVPVDTAAAQAAYARIEASCTECHKAFRDTPAVSGSR